MLNTTLLPARERALACQHLMSCGWRHCARPASSSQVRSARSAAGSTAQYPDSLGLVITRMHRILTPFWDQATPRSACSQRCAAYWHLHCGWLRAAVRADSGNGRLWPPLQDFAGEMCCPVGRKAANADVCAPVGLDALYCCCLQPTRQHLKFRHHRLAAACRSAWNAHEKARKCLSENTFQSTSGAVRHQSAAPILQRLHRRGFP